MYKRWRGPASRFQDTSAGECGWTHWTSKPSCGDFARQASRQLCHRPLGLGSRVELNLVTRLAELAGEVFKPIEIKPGRVLGGVVVEMLPDR